VRKQQSPGDDSVFMKCHQVDEDFARIFLVRAQRSGARNHQSGNRNRKIDTPFDYEQLSGARQMETPQLCHCGVFRVSKGFGFYLGM
jgi:hypothetical protein